MIAKTVTNKRNVEYVTMPRNDYFFLPETMRRVRDTVEVLATVNRRQVFVPVRLVS